MRQYTFHLSVLPRRIVSKSLEFGVLSSLRSAESGKCENLVDDREFDLSNFYK